MRQGTYYQDFVKRHGVKESSRNCIHMLWGKRCNCFACKPPAADHCDLFNKNGKPYIFVSQPYSFNMRDMRATVAFCEKFGLTFEIDERAIWHNPGSIIGIVYKKKETNDYYDRERDCNKKECDLNLDGKCKDVLVNYFNVDKYCSFDYMKYFKKKYKL